MWIEYECNVCGLCKDSRKKLEAHIKKYHKEEKWAKVLIKKEKKGINWTRRLAQALFFFLALTNGLEQEGMSILLVMAYSLISVMVLTWVWDNILHKRKQV